MNDERPERQWTRTARVVDAFAKRVHARGRRTVTAVRRTETFSDSRAAGGRSVVAAARLAQCCGVERSLAIHDGRFRGGSDAMAVRTRYENKSLAHEQPEWAKRPLAAGAPRQAGAQKPQRRTAPRRTRRATR